MVGAAIVAGLAAVGSALGVWAYARPALVGSMSTPVAVRMTPTVRLRVLGFATMWLSVPVACAVLALAGLVPDGSTIKGALSVALVFGFLGLLATGVLVVLSSRVVRFRDTRQEDDRRRALGLAPRRHLRTPNEVTYVLWGVPALVGFLVWAAITALVIEALSGRAIGSRRTPTDADSTTLWMLGLWSGYLILAVVMGGWLHRRQSRRIVAEDQRIRRLDDEALS